MTLLIDLNEILKKHGYEVIRIVADEPAVPEEEGEKPQATPLTDRQNAIAEKLKKKLHSFGSR